VCGFYGRCKQNEDDERPGGGGVPWLVHGALLGRSTIIRCYPPCQGIFPSSLPPEDALGSWRGPARCPLTKALHISRLHFFHQQILIQNIIYKGALGGYGVVQVSVEYV